MDNKVKQLNINLIKLCKDNSIALEECQAEEQKIPPFLETYNYLKYLINWPTK